jgi:hypothetical protein
VAEQAAQKRREARKTFKESDLLGQRGLFTLYRETQRLPLQRKPETVVRPLVCDGPFVFFEWPMRRSVMCDGPTQWDNGSVREGRAGLYVQCWLRNCWSRLSAPRHLLNGCLYASCPHTNFLC